MVSQIQLTNEFYSYDDEPFDIFDAPSYYESDEQLVLIACLLLLEQRYRLLQSMTSSRLVAEIDNIMTSFKKELKDTATNKVDNHVYENFIDELTDWNIPLDTINFDKSIDVILNQSITNLCNQLHDELKLKGMYHREGYTDDILDIKPNFRRASNKLKDCVGDALLKGKEKNHRNILKFVYGTDKLYRWLCVNDSRTCDWCLYQQSLPPRPIEEIPYDHQHGRCVLDPIDTTYSDEYYLILASLIV